MVLLNASTQVYGCNFDKNGNTKPVKLFEAVFDNGVELSFQANYADLASLVAASISAGYYATCVNEGLIRLESSPAGTLTANVTEGSLGSIVASGQP